VRGDEEEERHEERLEPLDAFAQTLCTNVARGFDCADGTSAAVPRRGEHLEELQ